MLLESMNIPLSETTRLWFGRLHITAQKVLRTSGSIDSHSETFLDLCVCFLTEFLKCRDRFMFSKFNTYVYKGVQLDPRFCFRISC